MPDLRYRNKAQYHLISFGLKKKIFVILSRIPYPLEKGDKLRAFYQIRELSKKHDLILCAINDEKPHPDAMRILKKFCSSVYFFRIRKTDIIGRLIRALFSNQPFQVAYFHKKSIHKQMEQLLKEHDPDYIFCQLIRTAAYAKNSHINKTIDYQDVFSAGLKRRLDVAPWYKRFLLRSEYLRVLRYEANVFDLFDKKTIISLPDRDKIQHPLRDEITVIPNGVDTGFFKPMNKKKRYDIVFTGNMGYPPNINGAEFLVKEIMPLVWTVRPQTTVAIAGATPSARVRNLASDKVLITGWVDDIRSYYASSKVFIAPMRIGTGLQNKVLEAMAMQIPCITSPLANKALGAREDVEIRIGKNAASYAQHILSLLADSDTRKKLGVKGHNFVLQHFNWESTTAKLEKVITG